MSLESLDVLHHLWTSCHGCHFLLTTTTTYRPDLARALSQSQKAAAVPNPEAPLHAGNSFSLHRRSFEVQLGESMDMFSSFVEDGRFFQLALEPLSREASVELTRDLVREGDESTIESIVASSGGNPLYVVQLTKSFVEDGAEEVHHARHSVANISTMCRRVEEIICFRLDQLDLLSQAVLKAASVAASRGRTFTPNLLAFALKKTARQLLPHLFHQSTADANASQFFHLNTGDAALQSNTSLSNLHAPGPVTVDPRVRDAIVQCLASLAERGEFVHPVASLLVPSRSNDELDGDDGAGVDLAEVRGDSDFEFRIPTEQSTIYALIIDEQREYFHGKVAQFFYRQRYESFAGDGVASSSRHISRANSHQVLRSASHHSLKSQPSSRRLSQAANPLTLQWLLSCEKEIAFHAEQAGLWSLAMRAYLHAAILSRRLGDHRHFVGGLLEAFKIVKCCEQDSGESITPLSLSVLHVSKAEKGPNTVAGAIARMFLTGEVNDSDGAILAQELGGELECVYNVFGSDVGSMVLAAKLNLFLADFYMLAFGEVHLLPEILGIALKLSIAARVCVVDGQSTKSTATTEALDDDQLVFVDGDQGTSIASVEGSDLAHFVCTHSSLVRADPASEYAQHNTWKETDGFETLFEDADGGVHFDAQLVLETLVRGDLAAAKARWRTARVWLSESQMLVDILRFGQDVHLYASAVLLQQLVYANDLDLVDAVVARVEHQLELHGFSVLMFIATLPAISALVLLERWELVARWIERMYQSIDQTHEIMAAEISLIRAMRQWLHAWLPLAGVLLPPLNLAPMVTVQPLPLHAARPGDVQTIKEGEEEDRDGDAADEGKRRASKQEADEAQLVLQVLTTMQIGADHGAATTAHRRRSSIANFSSFLTTEDLFVTALFFLRPDRPAAAPEMLPRSSASALEQWSRALPPTIARFVSHCGLAVESLGLQLLAMWMIHHAPVAALSAADAERHKEADAAFRVATAHIVHFATAFVTRITASAGGPPSLLDAAMLANLVLTFSMLQPLRRGCALIDEVLLGEQVPFRHTLQQLLHHCQHQHLQHLQHQHQQMPNASALALSPHVHTQSVPNLSLVRAYPFLMAKLELLLAPTPSTPLDDGAARSVTDDPKASQHT